MSMAWEQWQCLHQRLSVWPQPCPASFPGCLLDMNLNLRQAARHHLCSTGNEFGAFMAVEQARPPPPIDEQMTPIVWVSSSSLIELNNTSWRVLCNTAACVRACLRAGEHARLFTSSSDTCFSHSHLSSVLHANSFPYASSTFFM